MSGRGLLMDLPGNGPSTGSPAQGGYEYAVLASTNKDHPDYTKYWAGDKEVVRRVNEGWKQMPKGRG